MHRPASASPGIACGAYSAPRAITSASPRRVCSPTRTVLAAGSMAVTSPRTSSIPCRAACSLGREMASALRCPTISQRREGGKTCRASRSTSTTRSLRGRRRRKVCAATMPPSPAPSTRAVRLMQYPSEHHDLVGPPGPRGQLVHRAARGAFDKVLLVDPARVDAGAADADLRAGAADHAEHVADVVIALRHFLPALGAR